MLVWAICWKLEAPASSRHRTTCAPAVAVPTKPPLMTTFRPAVDGFGEELMVRLPGPHGVGAQHAVLAGQQFVVQHGVDVVQHGVDVVQQLADGQQTGCALPAGPVGSGQHGLTCGSWAGHTMCGEREDAPAGPAAVRIEIATAATRSESGTMNRRNAGYQRSRDVARSLPLFHKSSAALTRASTSGSGSESAPSPSLERSPRCQL